MDDRLAGLVRNAMALNAERASALDDAEARRELLARIVDQPTPPAASRAAPARRRRWRLSLAVGVAAAVVAVAALGVRWEGSPSAPAVSGGDVFAEHQVAQSCVEFYAPDMLAGRAFGFDGTVVGIGSSSVGPADGYVPVTFTVHRWFRGGAAATVVVAMPPSEGSFGRQGPYRVGSRLLVSGEPRYGGAPLADPVAWACGFTRWHSPDDAAAWVKAFR
jgi:hypothetical protein